MQWAGNQLINTQLLVGEGNYDKPQEQFYQIQSIAFPDGTKVRPIQLRCSTPDLKTTWWTKPIGYPPECAQTIRTIFLRRKTAN